MGFQVSTLWAAVARRPAGIVLYAALAVVPCFGGLAAGWAAAADSDQATATGVVVQRLGAGGQARRPGDAATPGAGLDRSRKAPPRKAGDGKSGSIQTVENPPLSTAGPDTGAGQKIYQRLLRSAAWIVLTREDDPQRVAWHGSGWVLDKDQRTLVTNHHVVAEGPTVVAEKRLRVYFPLVRQGELVTDPGQYLRSGSGFAAQVIDSDVKRDLAVLALEDPLPDDVQSLPLAAQGPRPGDGVHMIGNPGVSEGMWVYTSGTVRQVYRVQETFDDGLERDYLRVETQSPSNPGDSGGPVVNDAGQLVAVHHGSHSTGRLLTYEVDVSELKSFLEELRPLVAPKTAEQFNERGVHYYERGRYERAMADFTKAVALDPRLADAVGNRGWALLELGDPKTAAADFDRALQLNDRDPNFYQGRARAHAALEDRDRAVEDLTQAIRLAADDATLYNDRADMYYEQEEYRRAIKDYDRAIKLAPDEPDYYNSRGVCYAALEDYERAIQDYTLAIERDDNAAYYHNRGLAYHEARKYRDAAHDFLEVARLDGDYAKEHVENFDRRELRIVNATDESIKVWIKYHTKKDDGQWGWFPGEPDGTRWAVYRFEPGEEAFLEHEGFRINADRIRLWAANDDESHVWSQFETQDYVLAAESYPGFVMDVFVLTIE